MNRTLCAAAAAVSLLSSSVFAVEGKVPRSGFGRLDHVFLIIMENQTDMDVLGNPNAPFINRYVHAANQARNYFAVGHPSAPNYLELVGGSNFRLAADDPPAWIGMGCVDNAPGGSSCRRAFKPIAVPGVDNAVVATAKGPADCNGEVDVSAGAPVPYNCALRDYPAAAFTPESIADQLAARKLSWKTYQESLPMIPPGVRGVNYADGVFSNLSSTAAFAPGPIQKLYAVKHDPFAYFAKIESGRGGALSLAGVEDFDGPRGLWAALRGGDAPNFAFIVPNQCHDMHGYVSGGPPSCSSASPADDALLMAAGDAETAKLVEGIKASRAWRRGRNALILVWDENDFSNAPNRVVMTVETNYVRGGRASDEPYDHYSLLRTLEAGFGLPCLNHACDATSRVMNDLFGGK